MTDDRPQNEANRIGWRGGMADVVVDSDDDIATVRSIYALAASKPSVLAFSVAPELRGDRAVIWAILRALGKRADHLQNQVPGWADVLCWLRAHQVTELIVLRAQHLLDSTTQALDDELRVKNGIVLTLVYSGTAHLAVPTTTVDMVLTRQRQPIIVRTAQRLASIPRTNPLRLRYDLALVLPQDKFERVDRLLNGAFVTAMRWLMTGPTEKLLDLGLQVLTAADDPEHSYLRRSAAELALLCCGIAVPGVTPLQPKPRPLSAEQLYEIRAHTNPAIAGYLLAAAVTGLSDQQLELISGDQVSDDTILGHQVPDAARSILRALPRNAQPVLTPPRHHARAPLAPDEPPIRPNPEECDYAQALAKLLHGRRAAILALSLSASTLDRFERLLGAGILELGPGGYRGTHVALYSTYTRPELPTRASATANYSGRCTAIDPDSH